MRGGWDGEMEGVGQGNLENLGLTPTPYHRREVNLETQMHSKFFFFIIHCLSQKMHYNALNWRKLNLDLI